MATFVPVEELEVYKLAERMADAVWEMVMQWNDFTQRTMGAQLIRASDSVGANSAEGASEDTVTEHRRFVLYARRSLREVRFFLRRALARQLTTQVEIDALKPVLNELCPRLTAYDKSIDRRCRKSTSR